MKHFAMLASTALVASTSSNACAKNADFSSSVEFETPAAAQSRKTDDVSSSRSDIDPAAEAAAEGPGAPSGRPPEASGSGSSEDIIVTGLLRRSLASAAQIKRNSDAILDAVVAQDIGKLPDDSAAETLARIPGVQVDRNADQVTQVIVRGLPNVATTYNGREFFTAELRRAQLQDLPAQALAGLEVYKSGTADLIEPGLAGLVNVRTRRPLDFKGLVVGGGLRGAYNDQSKLFDPSGNILLSNRWDTGIGEMGALINLTYSRQRFYNATRFNNTFVTDSSPTSTISPNPGKGIRYPYSVGLYNPGGKRWLPSGNVALQWKPNSDLEFYAEGYFQGYRANNFLDLWENDLRAENPALSNVVLVDGTNYVKSMTKNGGVRQQAFRSTHEAYTDSYQVATGAVWHTGRATLSTDFAYTSSIFKFFEHSLDSALASPQTIDVDFMSSGGASFSLPNFKITDPSQYIWRGYFESRLYAAGTGYQWRGDLDLDTDPLPLLRSLKVGYRVTTRKAERYSGSRYANTEALKVPLSDLSIGELSLITNGFRGNAQGFTQYLSYPFAAIDGNQSKLRQLSREGLRRRLALDPNNAELAADLAAWTSEDVQVVPAARFLAEEKTYAAYISGKFGFDVGSMQVDGTAGVRAIITNGQYSGTSRTTVNGVTTATPQTLRQDYVDVLPSMNMRVKFTDALQLRLGYTHTRTQPEFGDLNPAVTITQATGTTTVMGPAGPVRATGGGGNPDLKPLTSKNYDASLEWYFSKSGSVSAAIFYRDLFGFINNYARFVQDPTFGYIRLNRPENSGEGRISGAEVGFQSFLGFLPGFLKGFGVQGNATYLNAKTRNPTFDAAGNSFTYGPFRELAGISRIAYNASVFYEKDGIVTRLSYNKRSSYISGYGVDVNNKEFANRIAAISRLDFSFGYDITKNITISADATNLLAKPFSNYFADPNGFRYTQDVRYEGRYFGLGFRFRFGE